MSDAFNVLANPYTTTRPKVTLGPDQLFNAIDEPYTDKFLLGDLNVQYDVGRTPVLTVGPPRTLRGGLRVRLRGGSHP